MKLYTLISNINKNSKHFLLIIIIAFTQSCEQPTKEENDKKINLLITKSDSLNSVGKYDEAIELIDEALEIKDSIAFAYIVRGNAYMGLSKFKKAKKDFTIAIEKEGKNSIGYLFRAKSNLDLEEYEDFKKDIDNYLKNYPTDTIGLTLRSNYNLKVNKKLAKSDLLAIYSSDTNSITTIQKLAKVLYDLNEKEKSLDFYHKYYNLSENAKKDSLEFILGKINFEIKELNKSKLHFLNLERNGKNLDSTYYFVSEIYIKENNFSEAIKYLDKKISVAQDDYISHFKKSQIYDKLDKKELAIISSLKGLQVEWGLKNLFLKAIPLSIFIFSLCALLYFYFKKFKFEDYDRKSIKKAYLHLSIIPFGLHNIYLNFYPKFYLHSLIISTSIIYFSFDLYHILNYHEEIMLHFKENNISLKIMIFVVIYFVIDAVTTPIQTFLSVQKERKMTSPESLGKQKKTLKEIVDNLEDRKLKIENLYKRL